MAAGEKWRNFTGQKEQASNFNANFQFNNFSAQFAMFTMSAVRTILQLQTTSGNT